MDSVLHDSTYMKCPVSENPQRQKENRWLPGAGVGGGGVAASGPGVSF